MSRTRKQYMHPRNGLCVLISPDPEDGALLIMERVGFNEPAGYFSCERSDLYHVGERVTGRMEKWVGDADAASGESVTVAVAPDDSLADPLGHNVPLEERRFMWEPTDKRYSDTEYAWAEIPTGVQGLLRMTVRGGVHRVVFGQWRRVF